DPDGNHPIIPFILRTIFSLTTRRAIVNTALATTATAAVAISINDPPSGIPISVQDNTRVQINVVKPLEVVKTPTATIEKEAMVEGRGDNHLKPSPEAGGD